MKLFKADKKEVDIVVETELTGFHNDMDNNDYHGDVTHLSSSSLKMLLKDPRGFHKKYILKEKEVEQINSNFIFGSYLHTLVLEPHKAADEYAIYHKNFKRGKEYDEFRAENPGKEVITSVQADKAQEMLETFKNNKDAVQLISGGVAEQSLFTDLDGVGIKVRPDYLYTDVYSGYIVDLKTTSERLDRAALMKVVAKYDYDLSAALYVDAYKQALGMDFNFYFVFMSKAEPAQTIAIKASKQLLENGRRKVNYAIKKYKKCLETGIWFKEGIEELYMFKNDLFFSEEEEEKEA